MPRAVVKDVGVRPPNDGQAAADDARPRPPEDVRGDDGAFFDLPPSARVFTRALVDLMTMTKLTMASLLLATTAALRPPPVRATSLAPSMSSQNPQSRRALLLGALGTVTLSTAKQVFAEEAPASEDLSMPEEGQKPIAIGVITVGDGQTKPKVNSTTQRIKDLKALGGKMTDKQKKELKRLQQDEMCDLLGRGC